MTTIVRGLIYGGPHNGREVDGVGRYGEVELVVPEADVGLYPFLDDAPVDVPHQVVARYHIVADVTVGHWSVTGVNGHHGEVILRWVLLVPVDRTIDSYPQSERARMTALLEWWAREEHLERWAKPEHEALRSQRPDPVMSDEDVAELDDILAEANGQQ